MGVKMSSEEDFTAIGQLECDASVSFARVPSSSKGLPVPSGLGGLDGRVLTLVFGAIERDFKRLIVSSTMGTKSLAIALLSFLEKPLYFSVTYLCNCVSDALQLFHT